MNRFSLLLCVLLLSLSASTVFAADAPVGKTKLVHVVALKFKDDASTEDVKKIEDAFRAMKSKISEIASYEGGANVSKEGKNKGFQHCSVLSFKSQKDLDTYVAHTVHQDFVKMLGGIVVDAFVVDYWE